MAEPVLDNSIDVVLAPENTTNLEVSRWIRSHEKQFMNKLQEVADKMDAGYTQIVSTSGPENATGDTAPKLFKLSTDKTAGSFTGSGMCTIAVAALEQALLVKYGDDIDIEVVHVSTNNMDLGEDDKKISKALPHYILRFKTKNESKWWTCDPTYRQFQEKVKIGKMIITPSKNEDKIYTFNKLHEELDESDSDISKVTPEVFPKDQLFDRLIMKIAMKDAEMKGVSSLDLYQISQTFLDEAETL